MLNIASSAQKYSAIALSVTLLVYMAFPTLSELVGEWQLDEFSHSFFLPVLGILIARYELSKKKHIAKPSWLGLMVLFLGCFALLLGDLSTLRHMSYMGIIIIIVGMVLVYYGVEVFKTIYVAIMIVVFAIPLPFMLYNPLSLNLQLISSAIGTGIIQALGFAVYRDGNIIDLGRYKLQVVDACSGLRYLFPIFSLSFFMAYLMDDTVWKKLLLVVLSIPITIAINSLRIGIIGVTVNVWGVEAAEGFIHIFEGYVTFIICLIILTVLAIFLSKIPPRGSIKHSVLDLSVKANIVTPKLDGKISVLALLMIVLMAPVYYNSSHNDAKTTPLIAKPFINFPDISGAWNGSPQALSQDILNELDLTDYYLADYQNSLHEQGINLYIAYYAKQEMGSSIHSPMTCLPGGGWKITAQADKVVPVEARSTSIGLPIKSIVIESGQQKLLVYYWFKERERYTTSKLKAKWYLFEDSLSGSGTDGALIRITTAIDPNENEATADIRLNEFLLSAFPQIESALPATGRY